MVYYNSFKFMFNLSFIKLRDKKIDSIIKFKLKNQLIENRMIPLLPPSKAIFKSS